MKVLCLGNNSPDTDRQTTQLAQQQGHINHGLIISTDIQVEDGYYHTSIYDLTHTQILYLVKQFDSLVLLNQSIEQWSHPDAFYQTVKVVDEIKSIIKVTKLIEYNGIKFFENLVESNKSFCIFPFIELLVHNGSTTVCCRSNTPVSKLEDITSWSEDTKYNFIRNKMLAGELIPEHCSTCYQYEHQGIKSARQQETVEWANRLNLKSLDDLINIQTPSYYEVRPGNICNLQCRSCGPENSNLIEKEYIKIGLHSTDQKFEYTNFNFVKFDNLKKLYLAGGEPTAMPEVHTFLQKCIDENNVDFEFLINTNAVKFSNKLKELFKHFTNLQFIVSIDGFEKINHYVRWPSEWDIIIENTHYLIEHKHKVAFNVVVSIYTISRLDQLLKFLDEEFPNTLVHCTLAEFKDDLLNPLNYFDLTLKDRLVKITKLNCYKNDQLLNSFINGLISYYENPKINVQTLKEFFEFNDKLDQSRNIQLKDYIPELEEYRNRCYNKV